MLHAWCYHKETHVLLGSYHVYPTETPGGGRAYLLPLHVTLVDPPEPDEYFEGEVPVFDEERQRWVVRRRPRPRKGRPGAWRAGVVIDGWAYHPSTHVYTDWLRIKPEVAAEGRTLYQIPPHSTLIEPPLPHDRSERLSFVPVFFESQQCWHLVADHRGELWRDVMGRRQVIERLGDPAEWGMHPA